MAAVTLDRSPTLLGRRHLARRVHWVPVWSTGATLKNIKAGLFAFNGAATTTNLRVAFDFFHLSVSG